MIDDEQQADLDAIGAECRAAADVVLAACETILAEVDELSAPQSAQAQAIRAAAIAALEACTFQDVVGQRLTRLRDGAFDDPLLAGPANQNAGLGQADVDALFA